MDIIDEQNARQPITSSWSHYNFEGCMLRIILPRVSNITTLSLHDEAVGLAGRLARPGRHPVRLHFPVLTHLSLAHGDEYIGFDIGDVSALLACAPRLENLSAVKCGDGEAVPLKLQSLRSISLSQTTVKRPFLQHLIQQTPNLRDFRYEPNGSFGFIRTPNTPSPDPNQIVPRDITRLLVCRKDTLRTIDVDFTQCESFPRGSFAKRDVMRSFRDFAALEGLRINTSDVYERAFRRNDGDDDDDGDDDGNGDGDTMASDGEGNHLPPGGRLRRLADMIPEGLRRLEVRGGVYAPDGLRIADKIRDGHFRRLELVRFGSIYGGNVADVRAAFSKEGVECSLG
jgi:hypothetical protein